MKDWLHLALRPSIVRRALKYALVVGLILIAINHGGALWIGDVDMHRCFRMALTVAVPYTVSTLSSVAAIRHLRAGDNSPNPRPGNGSALGVARDEPRHSVQL
jgi:hypothetical protein